MAENFVQEVDVLTKLLARLAQAMVLLVGQAFVNFTTTLISLSL